MPVCFLFGLFFWPCLAILLHRTAGGGTRKGRRERKRERERRGGGMQQRVTVWNQTRSLLGTEHLTVR